MVMTEDLQKALEKFGRIVQKPMPIAHIGEPEPAGRRPIEHTGTAFRPMNRSVSPNQFSLPGMEHLGHPLASHVAAGVRFDPVHSAVSHEPGGFLESRLSGRAPKPAPLSFNPTIKEHSLYAEHKSESIGELHWAGEQPEVRSHYPGEVTWVRRNNSYDEDDPDAGPPKHRGVMAGMFAAAHETNFGQTTVPVHSTDRSAEGEAWSAKVGPPELRPRRGDDFWAPRPGIHPFERAGQPRQLASHMAGQREMFKADRYDRDPF